MTPTALGRVALRRAVLALGLFALAATLPFWLTDLDLAAARRFLAETGGARWPLGEAFPYRLLYRVGSLLSWLFVAAALLVLTVPALKRRVLAKQLALTLLLTLALGPGLLVNALGKDFTGRPRPRHVEQLGGYAPYLRPLELGIPGVGKSFPCGHCSVGFAVGAVGLVLLPLRPALGFGVLVLSFGLGGAVGAARMAAGAHFLSDVLWSAVATFTAALIAQRVIAGALASAAQPVGARVLWLRRGAIAVVLVGSIAGLLFARPFHKHVSAAIDPAFVPASIALDLDDAELELRVDGNQTSLLELSGEVRGFGFPNVDIAHQQTESAALWRYRLVRVGWPSEIEAPLRLSVRPEALDRLEIRIRRGSVRLAHDVDATAVLVRVDQPRSGSPAPLAPGG